MEYKCLLEYHECFVCKQHVNEEAGVETVTKNQEKQYKKHILSLFALEHTNSEIFVPN